MKKTNQIREKLNRFSGVSQPKNVLKGNNKSTNPKIFQKPPSANRMKF